MAHNPSRALRMQSKSSAQLREIAKSGTLSAAAARYELARRDREAPAS